MNVFPVFYANIFIIQTEHFFYFFALQQSKAFGTHAVSSSKPSLVRGDIKVLHQCILLYLSFFLR